MRHGRGDESKIGIRNRLRKGPRDVVIAPEAELTEPPVEVPSIRVATRDFR
ncbi:hypothetical protein J4G37_24380 [Microvirga sp. 3-52]|nr:hypothetical protein [Microvirga sp. 3-52]